MTSLGGAANTSEVVGIDHDVEDEHDLKPVSKGNGKDGITEQVYDISRPLDSVEDSSAGEPKNRSGVKLSPPNSGKSFAEDDGDAVNNSPHFTERVTEGDGWKRVEIHGGDMSEIGPMLAGMMHKSMMAGMHARGKRGAMP